MKDIVTDKNQPAPGKARGFAAMDPEEQRVIATMGGKAVPDEKRSFSQNKQLAVESGRKGGQNLAAEKRGFSVSRELAAAAGRKGGRSVPRDKRLFVADPTRAAEAGRKGGLAAAAKKKRGLSRLASLLDCLHPVCGDDGMPTTLLPLSVLVGSSAGSV
jgi:uncharacterized protein